MLFQSAEPSPPLFRLKGVRFNLHVAAYKILGFSGSITISTAPEDGFENKTLFQDLPPSVLLNTPLSLDGL